MDVTLDMTPYILLDRLGVLVGEEGLQVMWQWYGIVTGRMDVEGENALPTLTPLTVLTKVTRDL